MQEAYPQCLYGTFSHKDLGMPGRPIRMGHDTMVKGIDGKVRRFPSDTHSTSTIVMFQGDGPGDLPVILGRTFLRQLGMLYDAHKDAVLESVGEYVIDSDMKQLIYKVGDTPVQSLRTDIDVFPLPGAKWMMPQVSFRGCTYACEKMMLLEGKTAAEAVALMHDFQVFDNRREDDDIAASLSAASGLEARVFSQQLTSDSCVAALQEIIAKHGPVMLNISGHARILDAIESSPEGHVFSVRDPFTGNFLKIRDHEEFWSPNTPANLTKVGVVNPTDKLALRKNVTAIFLTQQPVRI
ncbi:MAG: hypothetical protein H7327_03025 [Herminiimonas sp.]|nr:hypothetical protein [Herminiimonas sp.]